jgi:hypothetical protein
MEWLSEIKTPTTTPLSNSLHPKIKIFAIFEGWFW